MHFIKKNIIIPLVVFIIGMSAVAGIVCSINNEQNKQIAFIFLSFSFFKAADSRKTAIIAAAIPLQPMPDIIVKIL